MHAKRSTDRRTWLPALTLHDLRLSDAQGRTALRLPEVKAVLSLRSLYALELRFAQLLISKPELELRRDKAGRIFVAGLDLAEGERASYGAGLADWFFSQPEFVIREGRLRGVGEKRQAPPPALTRLDLPRRNRLARHRPPLSAFEGPRSAGRSCAGSELPRLDLRATPAGCWTTCVASCAASSSDGELANAMSVPVVYACASS